MSLNIALELESWIAIRHVLVFTADNTAIADDEVMTASLSLRAWQVYIPKEAKGKMRSLGISCYENKLVEHVIA